MASGRGHHQPSKWQIGNLAETLDQVLGAHSQTLKALAVTSSLPLATSLDGTEVVPVLPPQLSTKEQRRAEQRRARRLANLQQVWELHEQGWSAPAIACQVGIGRASVFRYLRSSAIEGIMVSQLSLNFRLTNY